MSSARAEVEPEKGENRIFGWLQLLNQGRNVWCVAVSDAHGVFSSPAGDWRTYVPSSTDQPSQIDHREIIRNSKAGRMMISNGPFLQVETADGMPIGSHVVSEGSIDLEIKVQTANWLDIDRVQILVNGRQHPKYNYIQTKDPSKFKGRPLVFDETVRVELQEDAHLIVVATGEKRTSARVGDKPVPQPCTRSLTQTRFLWMWTDRDSNPTGTTWAIRCW